MEQGSNRHKNFIGNIIDAIGFKNEIFFLTNYGLHRMDLKSRITESWSRASASRSTPLNHRFFKPILVGPIDAPIYRTRYLARSKDILLMFPNKIGSVVGYQPDRDCWYGPVNIPAANHAIVEEDRIWLGSQQLSIMMLDNFKKTALIVLE